MLNLYSWPSGTVQKIESFGVIPINANVLDVCLPNDRTRECEGVYNHTSVLESIESSCIGKEFWTIDFKSFVHQENESSIWTNDRAQFYTQVFWKFDQNELKNRVIINKVLVAECIFVILILLGYFHFTHQNLNEKHKEWDIKTTKIQDYTLKFDIPQQLYDSFIQNVYKAETNENPVYAFKKFLHDQFCELINKNKQITWDDTSEIKIVDIEFTFKSSNQISSVISTLVLPVVII